MNKQELIQLIVVRSGASDPQLSQALSEYTVEELERYIRLEVAEETLLRTNAERAADATLHKYREWKADEPRRLAEQKASLEKDRRTFEQAAPRLRSYGLTDANFSVIRSTLGPDFTEFAIRQGITSNALSLSPASQEELIEWQRDFVEKENFRRLAMDTLSLRELVKQEREAKQAVPSVETTEEQRKLRALREDVNQYETLPDEFFIDGESKPLDAQLIERVLLLPIGKSFLRRYGPYQIDEARIKRRPGLHW